MQRVWLLLVFPQLLESCHHAGSGYRLWLSCDPHPFFNQFLYELLDGVHLAMNQECQYVTDSRSLPRVLPVQPSAWLPLTKGLYRYISQTARRIDGPRRAHQYEALLTMD